MKYHNYRFYLDVSGKIGEDSIFIGSILFNEKYRKNFIQDFKENYPNLDSFRYKATNLKKDKLKEIIEFLNDKKIKMCCLHCPKNKFNDYQNLIFQKFKSLLKKDPKISHSRERLLSILYYYNLKTMAYKNVPYEGNVCMETQIKIDKVLSKLSSISQRDKYFFYLNPNWRRLQHMLKFADFVASAGKRLDENYLKNLKYFNLFEADVIEEDLNHAFGYNKLKSDIVAKKKKFIKIRQLF